MSEQATQTEPGTDLAIIAPDEHDRQKYIGGSDVAAVLGISPWRTPLDLFNDKIKPRKLGPVKKVFSRGIRWESVVAEMLTEALVEQGHKVEVIGTNRRFKDDEHPFMAAEIDYEIRLDDDEEITNVELKTVHPFKMREWGETGSDQLPIHYTAQVMHGLGVTRRRKGMLAALFGADELRTYPVDGDEATIAGIRRMVVNFWQNHVMQGIAPPPTNLADLAKLFPTDVDGRPPLLADNELTMLAMRAREIGAQTKALEAEYERIEFQLKLALKDCGELILPNGKTAFTWKTMSGNTVDQERLKKDHPKLFKEYQKPWESRPLVRKAFSIEGLEPDLS